MSAQILEGYSSSEKAAYITAIASIATADQSATEQEIAYISNLADAAGLNSEEKQQALTAAKDTSGQPLKNALDVLKLSELRYSLVADLIAFADADSNVGEQEKKQIASIASYLNINADQLQALNEYVREAAVQPVALGLTGNRFGGAEAGLLDGLTKKLQGSGIDIGSLAKGLISFVGPMIMGKMLNKGLQSPNTSTGLGQGNLGSLISSLSGGKGFSGIGGFLTNLLK